MGMYAKTKRQEIALLTRTCCVFSIVPLLRRSRHIEGKTITHSIIYSQDLKPQPQPQPPLQCLISYRSISAHITSHADTGSIYTIHSIRHQNITPALLTTTITSNLRSLATQQTCPPPPLKNNIYRIHTQRKQRYEKEIIVQARYVDRNH